MWYLCYIDKGNERTCLVFVYCWWLLWSCVQKKFTWLNGKMTPANIIFNNLELVAHEMPKNIFYWLNLKWLQQLLTILLNKHVLRNRNNIFNNSNHKMNKTKEKKINRKKIDFLNLTFSVRPRNSHIGIAEPEQIDSNDVKTANE